MHLLDQWATDQITKICPYLSLGDVQQLVSHSFDLGQEEAAEYLLGFIGMSDEALAFLEEYNSKRFKPVQVWGATVKESKPKPKPPVTSKSKKNKKNKPVKQGKVGHAASGVDGKPICECMATVHDLVANCMGCGKIICQFEGDEACPFCGLALGQMDKQEHEYNNQQGHYEQQGYYEQQGDSNAASELDKAMSRKERLLDYDRHHAARSKIIDQASDFDSSQLYNKWKSPEERAAILKKMQQREREQEEVKKKRVITLDLENQRVLIEQPTIASTETIVLVTETGDRPMRNPLLKKPAPQFVSSETGPIKTCRQ